MTCRLIDHGSGVRTIACSRGDRLVRVPRSDRVCPSCGNGVDTDGDGNCALCRFSRRDAYEEGRRVHHTTYGPGTIMKGGKNDTDVISVVFDLHGYKDFVLGMCKSRLVLS